MREALLGARGRFVGQFVDIYALVEFADFDRALWHETAGEGATQRAMRRFGDHHAAGFRAFLQFGRDGDAVADQIAAGQFGDFTQMHAGAHRRIRVCGNLGGGEGAAGDVREFHQHGIAGGVEDAPAMRFSRRAATFNQPCDCGHGAGFISFSQRREPAHVDGDDCCQPACAHRYPRYG